MQKIPFLAAGLVAGLFCSSPASLLAQAAADQGTPYRVSEDAASGAATITAAELKTWLTKLTSKEFAGRGTGQKGFGHAAAYIRDHFKGLGLKPGGDDGKFFQVVPWKGIFPDLENTYVEVKKGDKVVARITGETGLNGQVTKARKASGVPIYLEVHSWRRPDMEDFELEDRIVFLHITARPRRGNLLNPSQVLEARSYATMARAITRAGAREVICVSSNVGGSKGALVGSSWMGGGNRIRRGMQRRTAGALFIDQATMKSILAAAKPSKDQRQEIKDDDDKVRAWMVELLGTKVTVAVKMETEEPTDAPAYNVVGILEGSDPKLKDEYVAIGCHLDHLGVRFGVIHPGADDDGSGSAGLMAISQAFARNKVRPKRSVVFMAFCGEELGLIGSGYFANKSFREGKPIKLQQIVAELQVDMIGRDESLKSDFGPAEDPDDNKNTLHLIGTKKLSNDLHKLCVKLNEDRARFDLEWDAEGVFFRSDHWNFAKYGIPIAFFFTGFHKQYHQPNDTVDRINFPKLARVAAYVYDIGFELAQAQNRPLVEIDKWQSIKRRQGRRAPTKGPVAPLREKKDGDR